MTAEVEDHYTELRFSSCGNAFLADAILMQRYIEMQGKLRRVHEELRDGASPFLMRE